MGRDEGVFGHGQGIEAGVELEGARDAPMAQGLRRGARDGDAVEEDVATIGRVEAGDHVEERRLAGSVGAADAQHLARRHVETQLLHRRQGAEML